MNKKLLQLIEKELVKFDFVELWEDMQDGTPKVRWADVSKGGAKDRIKQSIYQIAEKYALEQIEELQIAYEKYLWSTPPYSTEPRRAMFHAIPFRDFIKSLKK